MFIIAGCGLAAVLLVMWGAIRAGDVFRQLEIESKAREASAYSWAYERTGSETAISECAKAWAAIEQLEFDL